MFLVAAVALATPQVVAQTAHDPTEPGATPAPAEASPATESGWRRYPGERHILVRGEATVGMRLNDPYAAGTLAPPGGYLQGSFLFLHAGPFLMGPALGFQAAADGIGPQFAVQPGWQALARLSGRFGVTVRAEIPVLITRGACPVERVPADPGFQGHGVEINRTTLPVPSTGYCPTVSLGLELAGGAAVYLTSGVALTGEVIFDMYFGDSFIPFPVLGGGLGLMVDYEVLP